MTDLSLFPTIIKNHIENNAIHGGNPQLLVKFGEIKHSSLNELSGNLLNVELNNVIPQGKYIDCLFLKFIQSFQTESSGLTFMSISEAQSEFVNMEEGSVIHSVLYSPLLSNTKNININILLTGENAQDWTAGNIHVYGYLKDIPDFEAVSESFILNTVINPLSAGSVIGNNTNYAENEQVDLSAVAAEGFVFLNWTDALGQILSTNENYTFNMPGNNLLINANFEQITLFALNVTESTGGTVMGNSTPYAAGDAVTLQAVCFNAYRFVNWTDNDQQGAVLSTNPNYLFNMPAHAVNITANFELINLRELQVLPNINGNVINYNSPYIVGAEVNITAVPHTGFTFKHWENMQNEVLSTNANYIFNMPDANLVIDMVFEAVIPEFVLSIDNIPLDSGTVAGYMNSYAENEEVNITAIPNEGYDFLYWTDINDNILSRNANYIFNMPANNLLIKTVFEPNFLFQSIHNPMECTVSGNLSRYHYGDEVNVLVIPQTGYEFVKWIDGQGQTVSTDINYIFNMPSQNLSLTVVCNKIDYLLTSVPNPEAGGSISGNTSPYKYNDPVSLLATPADGFAFVNWTVGGIEVGNQPLREFNMPPMNTGMVANFVAIDYNLLITPTPALGGTISGNTTPYHYKDDVDVLATPAEGYAFVNWMVGEEILSTDAHFVGQMPNKSIEVIANFAQVNYNLIGYAFPSDDAGEIIGSKQTYTFGEAVNLQANAKTGYQFVNWTDNNGAEISTDSNYMFNMPSHDLTIHAVFELKEYALTATVTENNGDITGNTTPYHYGDNVALTAVPDENCILFDWTNALGVRVGTQPLLEFVMPAQDVTLYANIHFTFPLTVNHLNGTVENLKARYQSDEQVDITAVPESGYAFLNWTDELGTVLSTDANYIFNMPASALTINANFEVAS